ncbi:hypothetical protein HY025_01675, partial [Candidatus Daviesbacteria bacterium]|nr:hypothetical protein [Candidatus Daviesbacteria bacterium]
NLRRRYKKKDEKTSSDINSPLHNKILLDKDKEVPVGGGLLLIPIIVFLTLSVFFLREHKLNMEAFILVLTILCFGYIGLIDDVRKIFTDFRGKYVGLRSRYILLLQTFFAIIISLLLFFFLGLNNVFVPFFGNIILGWVYIPLAVLLIVSFANAYNISDGLDGLSTGLLLICLIAFLVLAHSVFDSTLTIFVGIWIGAIIAYLYFNVFPARIYLGDAGAFGFGATLAVVGLLSGKIIGLGVIGGVYVVIVGSSLLQIFSKRFLHKKFFIISPIHMYFKYIGWEEPKIVMRFWLAGAIFAIFGLWLSLLSH